MVGVTAVALGGLASVVGGVVPLVAAVVTGGLLAGTTAASTHQSPLGRAVVSVGAVSCAAGVLGTVAVPIMMAPLSIQTALTAGILLCVSLSVYGVGATITGGFGNRTLLGMLPTLLVTGLTVGSTAVGLQLRAAPEPLTTLFVTVLQTDQQHTLQGAQQAVFAPTAPLVGAATFGLVCLLVCVTVVVVIDRLPLLALAADSAQPRVKAYRARLKQVAAYGAFATLGATLLILVGASTPIPNPIGGAAFDLTATVMPVAERLTLLRRPRGLLVDTVLLLWATTAVTMLPKLTRVSTGRLVRWVPVLLSSVFTLLFISALYPRLYDAGVRPLLQSRSMTGVALFGSDLHLVGLAQRLAPGGAGLFAPPRTTVAAGVLIALVVVFGVVLVVLSAFAGVRLLPRHAAPGALAAGSLFLAGTLAGVARSPPVIVVLVIVCALLVWDLAEYGTTLRAELGPDASMRLPVVTHTLGAVLIGSLCLGVAVAVNRIVFPAVVIPASSVIVLLLLVAVVASAALLSRSAF
jgi:hypothetical protein